MVEGEDKYKQSMQAVARSNEAMGQSAGKLGDQINDLAGKLGVRLPEGATKALNGIQGFSAGTVAAMGLAVAGVTAFIKAAKELHEITMKAAADADELLTKSMTTGLSTETLQQWQYASQLVDVSVETMTGSMTKLTRAMYDASTGNEAAAAAFQALGVEITNADGSLRDAESVFYDTIDALGEVGNQTERDAMTMEIFGKSAQELNPLILQGSDALQELGEEAEATGYVLDESQIKKLGEVDDAYQRMQLQIEATKKELAVEFAPASKKAMELFTDVVQKAGQALVDSGLVENFAALVQSTLGLVEAGSSMIDALPSWINPIQRVSDTMRGLAIVMATVADAATIVAGILPWNWGSGMLKQGLGLGDTESNLQTIINHNRSGGTVLNAYSASGDQNWRGGLTWVGEAGPELVALPRGSQIYSNQESRDLGGGTDTSRIEALLARNVELLEEIGGEFSGLRVRRRMA